MSKVARKRRHINQPYLTSAIRRRETFGSFSNQPIKRPGVPSYLAFNRLPSRLAYCLKDIVDEEVLVDEAHVFLGFNKEGTYVISYTERFESSDHTGFITLVYRLHWWLFRQGMPMLRCRTIRLFANEEISGRLCLTYAEWPRDKTKVVITGYGKQTNICYITVAAVPSYTYCSECLAGESFRETDGEEEEIQSKVHCLKHGFVAHMKHTSVSSNSTVLSPGGLKIDDLLVLNMGHSIGVFSLGLVPNSGSKLKLPLSSIKQATYEDMPIPCQDDEIKPVASSDRAFDMLLKRRLNLFSSGTHRTSDNGSMLGTDFSDGSAQFLSEYSNTMQIQSDLFSTIHSQDDEEIRSPTQGSLFSFTSDDSLSSSQRIVLSENSISNANRCKHCCHTHTISNGDAASVDYRDDPYFDPEPKSIVLSRNVRENTKYCSQSASSKSTSGDNQNNRCYTNENCCCGINSVSNCVEHGTGCLNNGSGSIETVHSSNVVSKFDPSNKCVYCGRVLPANQEANLKTTKLENHLGVNGNKASPNCSASKLYKLSTMRNQFESSIESATSPSPNPSESSGTGSIYCNGDISSQGNLRPVCRSTDGIVTFIETFYGSTIGQADEPLLFAENSLFCGPVTFEGRKGIVLNPIKPESSTKSVTFCQNLVLDIEHVIFDVLRTRCYTTYKFGYLIDYEVQIIDVCPGTRSVIMLIVALLNVSAQKSKTKLRDMHFRQHKKYGTVMSALQQFECFLCWRLQTGRYEVIAASPLQPYPESKQSKWNAKWVVETVKSIRKTCGVPTSVESSVYALSNLSVIQGKSLNLLWDSQRMVALRK